MKLAWYTAAFSRQRRMPGLEDAMGRKAVSTSELARRGAEHADLVAKFTEASQQRG